MRLLSELAPLRRDSVKLPALFALYFLVVCSLGMLRPIKNTLALDGLGGTEFYRVYLVSAAIVLFVPLYNRLADRVSWRALIPGVAYFFTGNLVLFRVLYREGSAGFGLLFYGWYDLFAAALVTQFFMATQLIFNAREAKRAYPLVIAGGAVGGTLGGGITGFLAQQIGTPNLLLVAAVLIAVFGLSLPFVWPERVDARFRPTVGTVDASPDLSRREVRTLLENPHLRLISASVLLTMLAKQFVDYQFNAFSEWAFVERDAIAGFQGKFFAATQWLPIVILSGLRPLLRRYGVGLAVLLLPMAVILGNVGLVLWFGIWAATVAKGVETSFRYAAERTAREILYVPVPEELKLRAKAYIDVALEKGAAKVLSALLILAALRTLDFRLLPWVTIALAGALIAVNLRVRHEYVRTLARSIQGGFASLRGGFASVADASSLTVLREALREGTPLQLAFVLDLLLQSDPVDVGSLAAELRRLLEHPSEEIRTGALNVLTRSGETASEERIRELLRDPAPAVREAAVGALLGTYGPPALAELLASEDRAVRVAALSRLIRGDVPGHVAASLARRSLERWRPSAPESAGDRLERALAVGAVSREEPEAWPQLEPLLADPDPRVASAAVRSAGPLGREDTVGLLLHALVRPGTREAARDALVERGSSVVSTLRSRLLDADEEPAVRRQIPSVLARIPEQSTVDALLEACGDPDADPLLAYRALKSLNKLRTGPSRLAFPDRVVYPMVTRATDAALRYGAALRALEEQGEGRGPAERLLRQALREAREDRRETAFRLLGLIHPPARVYRCYLAATAGDRRSRGNALEWLERTLGHRRYIRLAHLVEESDGLGAHPRTALRDVWPALLRDPDPWIVRCAAAAGDESGAGEPRDAHQRVGNLQLRSGSGPRERSGELELLKRVFLLQNVDLLQGTRSSYLALLATIAEEVVVDAGTPLVRRGEPTDALYVLIDGAVELEGVAGDTVTLGAGGAFGTWALINEEPSLLEAHAAERSRLLRISRGDFYDLLAEHGELSRDLLQGLARRVRELASGFAEGA